MKNFINPTTTSALVLLVALSGCTAGSNQDPADVEPVDTSAVSVIDDDFDPVAVTIPVDTEITWTWDANTDHNVIADNGDFESPTQREGTFSHTFNQPDTVAYRCTLHNGMDGLVVVTKPGASS